jgi:mRNA interferase MazF
MHRDYSKWNEMKISINKESKLPGYKEREIWFCSLGLNIGYEQNGSNDNFVRPVVIIKGFSKRLAWVIPLTKNCKENNFKHIFSYKSGLSSAAILSQIKVIDVKRFQNRSGYAPKKDFLIIKRKLREFLL